MECNCKLIIGKRIFEGGVNKIFETSVNTMKVAENMAVGCN